MSSERHVLKYCVYFVHVMEKKHFQKFIVFFLTAPPLKMSPDWSPQKKCHNSPPPKSFNYENHIQVLRLATFSNHGGGGSLGLLTFFF